MVGMNDFVTKPMELRRLFQVLELEEAHRGPRDRCGGGI